MHQVRPCRLQSSRDQAKLGLEMQNLQELNRHQDEHSSGNCAVRRTLEGVMIRSGEKQAQLRELRVIETCQICSWASWVNVVNVVPAANTT